MLESIQKSRTVSVDVQVLRCDRCRTEVEDARYDGKLLDRSGDRTGWLVMGLIDGWKNPDSDLQHFCPACAPKVIQAARGR